MAKTAKEAVLSQRIKNQTANKPNVADKTTPVPISAAISAEMGLLEKNAFKNI